MEAPEYFTPDEMALLERIEARRTSRQDAITVMFWLRDLYECRQGAHNLARAVCDALQKGQIRKALKDARRLEAFQEDRLEAMA